MRHIIAVQILYRFGFTCFSVAIGEETDRQVAVSPMVRKTLAALCIAVAVRRAARAGQRIVTRHGVLLTCFSYSPDTGFQSSGRTFSPPFC